MGLLGDLRGRGLAGADGPDRLVGQRRGLGPAGQRPIHLALENLESAAGLALLQGLARRQIIGLRP